MAFPLFFIGIILFVTGVTGETEKFSQIVKSDLQGDGQSPPFAVWIFAILMVGLIGAYKPLKPLSDGFLTLIVVSFLLSNSGLIAEFSNAIGFQDKTPDYMKPNGTGERL